MRNATKAQGVNNKERLLKANFSFVEGVYVHLATMIESLSSSYGVAKARMSQAVYNELFDRYSGEMYVEDTEENFKHFIVRHGGISTVNFVQFIQDGEWFVITQKEALENLIKEDSFFHKATTIEDGVATNYDFDVHEQLCQRESASLFNRRIDRLAERSLEDCQ